MIDIEKLPDSVLLFVIRDISDVKWDYLALKVMISRFRLKLSIGDIAKQRKEVEQQCCTEMRELFLKSVNVPNAMKDLKNILERFEAHG